MSCSLYAMKDMLVKKFSETDLDEARQDIEPVIKDTSFLDIGCKAFYFIAEKLTANIASS